MTCQQQAPRIVRAAGDRLFDDCGREYVDLFSANGTAWLGHAPPEIAAALTRQLGVVWNSGALSTPAREQAYTAIEAWFDPVYRTAGLLSTGMEAAEFALRIARVATSKPGAIGFAGSMHGKSLATSTLGWFNRRSPRIEAYRRLPFPLAGREAETLDAVRECLAQQEAGAVLVEPWLASAGGHAASEAFLRGLSECCRNAGALLIFDELLTGFHRLGPRFWFEAIGLAPDLVLVGKALGGGFPVAAVVRRESIEIVDEMLPGSTFAGNSLAAVAATATLEAMILLDLPKQVSRIETIVRRQLRRLSGGWMARGRGAMWILEGPSATAAHHATVQIYAKGVAVGRTDRWLRLLPAAIIDSARLESAIEIVVDETLATLG